MINQIPEGLKIIEDKDGIKVENIYQGRTLCAIVFPKEYKHEDLRIFQIQTLSKKESYLVHKQLVFTLTNMKILKVFQIDQMKNKQVLFYLLKRKLMLL